MKPLDQENCDQASAIQGDAPTYNAEVAATQQNTADRSARGVHVSPHVLRTAILLAEQSADEINNRLRETEQERDKFVRVLGDAQRKVDSYRAEREYRTNLVRQLQAAFNR
jgi:hypothetical protein